MTLDCKASPNYWYSRNLGRRAPRRVRKIARRHGTSYTGNRISELASLAELNRPF